MLLNRIFVFLPYNRHFNSFLPCEWYLASENQKEDFKVVVHIICADLSHGGKGIAYSSLATTRFFKFQAVTFTYFVMFRCVQNIGVNYCK